MTFTIENIEKAKNNSNILHEKLQAQQNKPWEVQPKNPDSWCISLTLPQKNHGVNIFIQCDPNQLNSYKITILTYDGKTIYEYYSESNSIILLLDKLCKVSNESFNGEVLLV